MNNVNLQEKQIKIDNLNINYKEIGNGDIPIVLLHGWGIDSDKYMELANLIVNSNTTQKNKSENSETSQESFIQENGVNENNDNLQKSSSQETEANEDSSPDKGRLGGVDLRFQTPQPPLSGGNNSPYKIIIPDLPGFGKSDEPDENWNLDNYVEFTDKFIKSVTQARGFELLKNIIKKSNIKDLMNGGFSSISDTKTEEKKKVILVGHSFGGRIAIKYAVKYPDKIEKLVLTGAAGIKHSLSRKQKILYVATKTGKTIFSLPVINKFQKYAEKFLYKIIREKDYRKASLRMKEIMKKVLAEDLTPILEKIKTTTLLLWGRLDNSTPLSDGKLMNEKIENSELVIFDDANHSLPYQKPEEFTKDIIKFIT
ncbi:MAG: alpha/beta hydrolase [Candidatus Pacebacteria bacterium]|nr:alpha/beta hydrolase [Candidatus Paceibacterota bacterium]